MPKHEHIALARYWRHNDPGGGSITGAYLHLSGHDHNIAGR
jgi:hypothetical protein